jgi:hypothetical protein
MIQQEEIEKCQSEHSNVARNTLLLRRNFLLIQSGVGWPDKISRFFGYSKRMFHRTFR